MGVRVCSMTVLWRMKRRVAGRNRDVEEDEEEEGVAWELM